MPTRPSLKLGLGGQATVLFAALLATFAAFDALSLFTLDRVGVGGPLYRSVRELSQARDLLLRLRSDVNELRATALAILLEASDDRRKPLRSQHADLSERILREFDQGKVALSGDPDAALSLQEAEANWAELRRELQEQLDPQQLDVHRARGLDIGGAAFQRRYARFLLQLGRVGDVIDVRVQQVEQSAATAARRATFANLAGGALLCLLVVGASLLVRRTVTVPLVRLSRATRQAAGGDLSGEGLALERSDEIGALSADFDRMLDVIKSLVHYAQQTAGVLTRASNELLQTGRSISSGASEQANQMADVSGSMVKMSTAIAQLVRAQEAVGEASKHMAQAAADGSQQVELTTQALSAIRGASEEAKQRTELLDQQSEQLAALMDAVEDVAATTNVLAMNASLEAARAGELGKGFAVIANEVRQLASRSAGASAAARRVLAEALKVIGQTREATDRSHQLAGEGAGRSQDLLEAFARIQQRVGETGSSVSETHVVLAQQAQEAQRVAGSAESVTRLARTTEGSTGEVLTQAAQLSETIAELEALLAGFQTSSQSARRG